VNEDGIEIRLFRPEDQQAAQNVILLGLGEHFGQVDPVLNPDLNNIRKAYLEAGHTFFVADAAGRVVGTGALVRESAHVGRIVRVSVAPTHRRQGIGRAMVGHLLQHSRESGLHTLLVETNTDWYGAIRLYLAHGFQEYERDEQSVHLRLSL
jgi:ribosomal protein S18 acetylase RimI-like enzyme